MEDTINVWTVWRLRDWQAAKARGGRLAYERRDDPEQMIDAWMRDQLRRRRPAADTPADGPVLWAHLERPDYLVHPERRSLFGGKEVLLKIRLPRSHVLRYDDHQYVELVNELQYDKAASNEGMFESAALDALGTSCRGPVRVAFAPVPMDWVRKVTVYLHGRRKRPRRARRHK